MEFPSVTKTVRNSSYPAISPASPAVSKKGLNVLITGGGSGIGRATALSFARAGASNIALIGRREINLKDSKRLVDDLQTSSKVHTFAVDMTDETLLDKAFDDFAQAIGGPIHILVANAGMNPGIGKSTDISTDAFLKGLTSNTIGTINTVKAYMRHIAPEGDVTGYKGRIIHATAGLVHCCLPMASTYAVSKVASSKYLEYVALENPEVHVINYYPGMVATAMNKEAEDAGMVLEPKDDSEYPFFDFVPYEHCTQA